MGVTNAPPRPLAAEFSKRVRLSEPARKSLSPAMTPGLFLGELLHGGHVQDAILFMAASMPPRERLWWGTLCVWHALKQRDEANPGHHAYAALKVVVALIEKPSEETATAVRDVFRHTEPKHPVYSLLQAATATGPPRNPPERSSTSIRRSPPRRPAGRSCGPPPAANRYYGRANSSSPSAWKSPAAPTPGFPTADRRRKRRHFPFGPSVAKSTQTISLSLRA